MRNFIFLTGLIVCFYFKAASQTITIDPVLEGITLKNGVSENESFDKIIDHQTKIQKFQMITMGIEDEINRIQQKTYDGMQVVSDNIRNAYQIVLCLKTLQGIYKNVADMLATAKGHPTALAFTYKIQKTMVTRAVGVYSELDDFILKAKDKKILMDAGERVLLMNRVLQDLQEIQLYTASAYFKVEWVVNQGIINAINPFSGMRNRDGIIVNQILHTWKF